jgi:hypothetical protein
MIKTCNTCNAELTNNNWGISWKRIGRTQCNVCNNPNRDTKNPERMYVNGKYINKAHPLYKAGNYKSFDDAAFSSLSNYNKNKEGDVYAIANPAWDGWIKIGMAVDAEDRLKSYQTSSPRRDYVLLHREFFNNRRRAEAEAHILASEKAEERRGEWFKINTVDAINIINSIDNTVKDGLQELKEVFTKKDKQGYYK